MISARAGLGETGLMNAALGLRADFFFAVLVVFAFFVLFDFFAIWPPRKRS
jgi:hypothetical protein